MYLDTVDSFAALAAKKRDFLGASPAGFAIGAMMAGAYIGLAIILIFSLGADIAPAYRPLVMGASFGLALILVVFAGAELFTGHTMFMTLGWLRGCVDGSDVAAAWAASWAGNLAGAGLLALVFVLGGGGPIFASKGDFLVAAAGAKMNAPALALFCRAALCNWCVCLALWMAARMTGDAAKCIAIAWCLFAFIASGYEHSVANMTLFAIALLMPHPAAVSLGGMGYNLFWVTLGNIASGALVMGAGYWLASRPAPRPALAPAAE
jgi:nitrite transporter NirC